MSFFRHCYSFICGKPISDETIIEEPYVPPKSELLKSVLPQHFTLPKPIVYYLLMHANVKNMRKLQQTCRYFYSKFHYIIIDNLHINLSKTIEITPDFNMSIPDEQTAFLQQNLYLTKKLYLSSRYNLKPLLSKLVKCDIYELYLYCYKLSISDYQFLTKFGNLKILNLDCFVYYSDGTKAPLEDILSYIPNVYHFSSWQRIVIAPETTKNLFTVKRNVKFKYFRLNGSIRFLNPRLFNDYIKEMFDFNDRSCSFKEIRLEAYEEDMLQLKQLYELVKTWRENTYLYDFVHHLTIK